MDAPSLERLLLPRTDCLPHRSPKSEAPPINSASSSYISNSQKDIVGSSSSEAMHQVESNNNLTIARQTPFPGLPDELIVHIFSFLDLTGEGPPSVTKFHQEPSLQLTSASSTPLKTLATVCRSWRRILLPQLFEYSRIRLPCASRWLIFSENLLHYCRHNIRGRPGRTENEDDIIRSLELFVDGSVPLSSGPNALPLRLIRPDDSFLRKVPEQFRKWTPSVNGPVGDYLEFVKRNKITQYVKSLVILSRNSMDEVSEVMFNCATREVEKLWRMIFTVLEPSRVVLVAPPTTMSLLTDSRMGTNEAWAFAMPLHYLEFSNPRSLDAGPNTPGHRPKSPSSPYRLCLHNFRSWTHLSYNEGSSVPAYAQYEYFNKTPPRVLYYILLWMTKELSHSNATGLESFKLVSIFPFARHVRYTLDPLTKMKELKHLELKLAPDPDSNILDDWRMGKADRKDCWREFNSAYSNVVRFFDYHFKPQTGFTLQVRDYENVKLREDLDRILQRLVWRKESDSIWTPQ